MFATVQSTYQTTASVSLSVYVQAWNNSRTNEQIL